VNELMNVTVQNVPVPVHNHATCQCVT